MQYKSQLVVYVIEYLKKCVLDPYNYLKKSNADRIRNEGFFEVAICPGACFGEEITDQEAKKAFDDVSRWFDKPVTYNTDDFFFTFPFLDVTSALGIEKNIPRDYDDVSRAYWIYFQPAIPSEPVISKYKVFCFENK